jgi:maleylpyruvate isomerase
MKLYSYFRSSAAYRVRIALAVKDLPCEIVPTHLKRSEHRLPDYLAKNPQGLVPTLEDGALVLGQSLAIIEYLEERQPEPALLPKAHGDRAQVRALALAIACDIHPLNNLRVLEYLEHELGADPAAVTAWYRHWVGVGFAALEAQLRHTSGDGHHCFGSAVTLADVCLVPQLYNARRYALPLEAYPTLVGIGDALARLPAFERASPAAQPDAE